MNMTHKRLFCAAVSAMAISAFAFVNQASAALIYDLRASSTTVPDAAIVEAGKKVELPLGYAGAGTITMQLWGVLDDGGTVGFADDVYISGNLNVVAKNKVGGGAISATSGVTGAALPVDPNFFPAGSSIGLGGANTRVRTTLNPTVGAANSNLAASAAGVDWGSDETYITLPAGQGGFTALAGYLVNGASTATRFYSWAMSGSGFTAGQAIPGFSQPGVGANAGKWEVLLGTFTVSVDGTGTTFGDQTSIAPFAYQRMRPTSTAAAVPGMNYKNGNVSFAAGNPINEALQLSGVTLTLIPEPSTYALIALGMGALAWSRRRKVAA
jgi:hypothetical protein